MDDFWFQTETLMDILITGTGRCGTGFMAQVLCSVDVKCTHEQVFNRKGWKYALEQIKARRHARRWGWQAESSWLATPFLTRPQLYPMTVVQVVRHPKAMIESNLRMMFYTHPKYGPFFNWMRKYIADIDGYETPFEKAAYWYIRLNEMAAERADLRHRVEGEPRTLLDALGVAWEGKRVFANEKYNSRPGYGPVNVNLDELPEPLRGRLRGMTEDYGYKWPG